MAIYLLRVKLTTGGGKISHFGRGIGLSSHGLLSSLQRVIQDRKHSVYSSTWVPHYRGRVENLQVHMVPTKASTTNNGILYAGLKLDIAYILDFI